VIKPGLEVAVKDVTGPPVLLAVTGIVTAALLNAREVPTSVGVPTVTAEGLS